MQLSVEVVTTTAALEGLAPEWEALLASCRRAEIFQTYEWLRSWWDVFGGDGTRQLYVIAVRDDDRLVGLAPLLLHRTPVLGGKSVTRLEFLGTGEDEADEVCSDFLDVIAADGFEQPVCEAVVGALRRPGAAWDLASFPNLLGDALITRCVAALAAPGEGRTTSLVNGRYRYYVDLSAGGYRGYLSRIPGTRRRRIARYQRRLRESGEFEEERLQDEQRIDRFLAELLRLNLLRRAGRAKPSAFESPLFRRFLAVVSRRLWARGWLDLRLWKLHGRPAAALLCLSYRGSLMAYQSGYDTAAFGNISPGLVTTSGAMAAASDQGGQRFDFLVGRPGSYKDDYLCSTESVIDVVLYNGTVAGQLTRSVEKIRSLVRQTLARSRSALIEPVPGRV